MKLFWNSRKRKSVWQNHRKNQTEKRNIVELKTNILSAVHHRRGGGHESLGERTKATRYEHILPALPVPRRTKVLMVF